MAQQLGTPDTIPNPFNEDEFYAPFSADREGQLLFVGRLIEEKGILDLLGALRLLNSSGLVCQLTVVGDGPIRDQVERTVHDSGLGAQVTLVGAAPPCEVAEYMRSHRIVVVPSRCEEAFGIVALEALACGCLPVVSRNGGLVDAVGGSCLTFDPGDIDGLARVLMRAMSNTELSSQVLDGAGEHLARCTSRAVAIGYLARFESSLLSRGNVSYTGG